MMEPAKKLVKIRAIGPTINILAIAVGDSVKCQTNKLSATRFTQFPKYEKPKPNRMSQYFLAMLISPLSITKMNDWSFFT